METYNFKTAILFLIYKRLDTTQKVFERIRRVKPSKLYIAGDGPKNDSEIERIKNTRDYVLKNIDWQCNVNTLFRENNLGCKYNISDAITWFFQNEKEGIILEDDCLPHISFFKYCEELLERYKDNKKIGMISGDNFQNGIKRGEYDYYFSIYNNTWGWASWKDRWEKYDVELTTFKNPLFIENLFKYNNKAKRYWIKIFNMMKENKIDSWAYQWTFTMWANNWLTIIPNVNLISNIGTSLDSKHTTGEEKWCNIPTQELILKNHPNEIIQNKEADEYILKNIFLKKSITFKKIVYKIIKIIMNYFNKVKL